MSGKERDMDQMNQPTPQPPPQPTPGGPSAEQLVGQLCGTVAGSATWMKLLGVLLIIYGIFMIITIVGILLCWLPIWLGVILFKAAGDAEAAQKGASQMLFGYVQKINRFFLIEGILALIGLIIMLIFVFLAGVGSLLGIFSSM
jgi:hypothetical protein